MNIQEEFKKFMQQQATEEVSVAGTTGRTLIVDGSNSYIRAFSATPTMNENGNHVGGITGFLLSIAAACRLFKPSRLVIAFDGAGGSQRRRQLFPDYKNNRRSMTKLNRTYDFKTLEQEKEAMTWQLKILVQMLRCLPITVVAPELVEADDVIAYIAQYTEEQGGSSLIMSTDKDFLQLVNEKTKIYNPIKKKVYDMDEVVKDYGFHPTNFLLYRTVTGDKSDCIPGVEGIKEKTLLKFFPELATSEKITIQQLLDKANVLVADKKKPPVALQSLLESKAQLTRNMKLMRLDDVAMSGSTRMNLIDELKKPVAPINQFELTNIAASHKFINAFGRMDEWVMTSFLPLRRHLLGT